MTRNLTRTAILAVMACALAPVGQSAPIYFLGTSQDGTDYIVNRANQLAWSKTANSGCLVSPLNGCEFLTVDELSPNSSWYLGGGLFTLRKGPATSQAIVLSVWEGPVGGTVAAPTGSLVASISLAASLVSNQYTATLFRFATPVQLVTGHSYTVTLTSNAGTGAGQRYQVKTFTGFTDERGNPLQFPVDTSDVAEPGTAAMLSLSFLMFFAGRSRAVRRLFRVRAGNR